MNLQERFVRYMNRIDCVQTADELGRIRDEIEHDEHMPPSEQRDLMVASDQQLGRFIESD